jgi:hypothetical protein
MSEPQSRVFLRKIDGLVESANSLPISVFGWYIELLLNFAFGALAAPEQLFGIGDTH